MPWLNGLLRTTRPSTTASSSIQPIEQPPVSFQRNSPSLPNYSPPSASSVKDLGVHLSQDMKWSLQATIAAQNANKMADWVLIVFSDMSKDVLLTLYKSIVRSRLEYSCPVWNPSSMQDIQKLEYTQRVFTCYISGYQGLLYWGRLKKLGLMSIVPPEAQSTICHLAHVEDLARRSTQ